MNTHTRSSSSVFHSRFGLGTLYVALPFGIFLLSGLRGMKDLMAYLSLLAFALLIAFALLKKIPRSVHVAVWVTFVLLLIGSSGWFYSPFFFALYLTAVGLGFLYTPSVAIAFTLSLVTLFVLQGMEIKNDILVFGSLLSVIPLVIALRRSYLIVQQEKKGILILETEDKGSGITSLDAILSNRVNQIGVMLRQPITFVKQGLSLMADDKLTEQEYRTLLPRMRKSADELFTLVKEFERGATKNALIVGVHDRTTENKRSVTSSRS